MCEGNSTRLFCPDPEDRLAVFSAFFGAQYEPMNICLPPETWSDPAHNGQQYQNQSNRCETAGATEAVMKLCSGRRECTVTANTETFGVPKCPPSLTKRPTVFHMKLVHTCLSKRVLKLPVKPKTTTTTTTTTILPITSTTSTTSTSTERHYLETSTSSSSTVGSIRSGTHLVDGDDDDDHQGHSHHQGADHHLGNHPHNDTSDDTLDHEKEPQLILMDAVGSNSSPRSLGTDLQTNPHANCSQLPASMQVIGFVSDWISAVGFIKSKLFFPSSVVHFTKRSTLRVHSHHIYFFTENKERLILYLLVSLFGSLVCFLLVLSVKLYQQKTAAKRRAAEDRACAPPVAPFDIIDFDEDDLDDLDGLPTGPAGSGGQYGLETGTYMGPSHRQYSYHVPQEMPSLSILESQANTSAMTTNSRPLLYSTLRKKPALKNTTTNTVPTNSLTNTTTFGPHGAEPWNTSVGSRSSTSRLLGHPQHYHLYQQQGQQLQQSTEPPAIIDYGLSLPVSMMPANTGGTLPRRGPLSSRNSTGSGILKNASTLTAEASTSTADNGSGAGGGGGGAGGDNANVSFVGGGYGDTDETSQRNSSSGFATMRRVHMPTVAINNGGGNSMLVTRFDERGLEVLEIEQPNQQQQHTEPKTLSKSLNNFFM